MTRPAANRAIAAGSLIVAGLVGGYVSFHLSQMNVVGSGINYSMIIGGIGGLLSAFLVGLALYLLFSGRKFLDLADGLILATYVAVVLLLFEGATYIALVLVKIAFASLNAMQ